MTLPTPDLSLVTDRLEIIVAGDPVAQARHRDRIVTARDGRSFVARYTPKETTDWRRAVLLAARQTPGFPSEPWDGPVRLSADAYFARPQRLCRKSDQNGAVRKNSDSEPFVSLIVRFTGANDQGQPTGVSEHAQNEGKEPLAICLFSEWDRKPTAR